MSRKKPENDNMPSSSKTEEGMEVDEEPTFLSGYKDIGTFSKSAFQAIVEVIKSANDLPSAGDDFDYYSSFEAFRNLMDLEGSRILEMAQSIMRYHGARGRIATKSEAVDVEDKYDILVDANDQMLERIGTFLDEASGIKKQDTPLIIATVKTPKSLSASWNRKPSEKTRTKSSNFRLLSAKNIQRSQTKFKDKIDNTSSPFVPKLKYKPNALKTLSESLEISKDQMQISESDVTFDFPHPYQYELDQFTPSTEQLKLGNIQQPLPLESCSVTFIETETELRNLIKKLKTVKEIAVDLENHSYRSYQGFTCLMQLSTRTEDFIVDTLLLRAELHLLNEVFTNPKILKVFHGADLDIHWLQRDFGVYVVNMFDTGQASRVLTLPRFSLAHLLSTYCQVEADKQYQLADWRIRPLPQELVKYAQQDTHYLLYIYDKLRHELINYGNNQNNLLISVMDKSKHLTAKCYKKHKFGAEDYMELYKRSKKLYNSQQLSALKELFNWRDAFARVEDESTGYVLPNHMLLQISEVLPREPQGILACCNPIPPLVRQNMPEIHAIIKKSRELPLTKLEPQKILLKPAVVQSQAGGVKSLLSLPHDTSHQHLVRDNVVHSDSVVETKSSSLFRDRPNLHICGVELKKQPILPLGRTDNVCQKVSTDAQKKAAEIKASFVSPLEAFLPMSVLERLTPANSGKPVVRDTEKWKLLPNVGRSPTKQREQVKLETVNALDSSEVDPIEQGQDDTFMSIKQMYPKAKKRASDGKGDDVASKKPKEGNEPKAAKTLKKVKKFLQPDEDFQAYNYSKSDYKAFEGKKKSKKVYDPYQAPSRKK